MMINTSTLNIVSFNVKGSKRTKMQPNKKGSKNGWHPLPRPPPPPSSSNLGTSLGCS